MKKFFYLLVFCKHDFCTKKNSQCYFKVYINDLKTDDFKSIYLLVNTKIHEQQTHREGTSTWAVEVQFSTFYTAMNGLKGLAPDGVPPFPNGKQIHVTSKLASESEVSVPGPRSCGSGCRSDLSREVVGTCILETVPGQNCDKQ